jgi:hypothetical protein
MSRFATDGSRRTWPTLVALLALAMLVAPLAGSAVAISPPTDGDPHVSVQNVTATPAQPAPGQRTEIRATVVNAPNSPDAVTVEEVALTRAGGGAELTQVDDLGTLAASGSLTVPLSVSFDEPGVKDLRVEVSAESDDGDDLTLRYPVTVVVREGGPRLDIDVAEATVGSDRRVAVNVSNGEAAAYRNLELTVNGTNARAENPRRLDAALPPGTDRTFDYDVTFPADVGSAVSARLRYTTPNGETRTIYDRVTVDVREGLGLDVAVEDPTVGGETPVSVTVDNGQASGIRDLRLTANGSNVRVENARRFAADLGAGGERTFTFDATFPDQVRSTVALTLRYTTAAGERRTLRETTTVDLGDAGEPVERPQVEVAVEDAVPGATRTVNVTVANGLSNEVRQLRVVADSPAADFEVSERVRSTLAAGGSATFQYPASADESGAYPVNVTLAYTEDGIRRRVSREFEASFGAPANPGEITLTDVQAVARGGSLEVSATASNAGSSDVGGVIVSTGGEQVADADYFVGSVDASDFASFTLSTTARGNVSTVPVEVSYVVDGVERSFTTDVPVRQAAPAGPPRGGGGGGLPLVPILVLVVLVAAGVAVYRWRG